MNKIVKGIGITLLCALMLTSVVSAHSGKTDVNGGHYNRTTGEYHYHHGYSAHSHYDMNGDGIIDCPYEFKDITNHNGSQSSSTTSSNAPTTKAEPSTKATSVRPLRLALEIAACSILVLIGGHLVWCLLYVLLKFALSWVCKTILKTNAYEETIDKVSIAITIITDIIIGTLLTLTTRGII